MPVVEKVERPSWPNWLLASVLIGALLGPLILGRGAAPDFTRDTAWAQADVRAPQSRPGRGGLEPPGSTGRSTFEEELERLHPSRTAQAEPAMCGRGSASGSSTGCCCGGRLRQAGSGSGSGSEAGAGGQCQSGCGGRGGQ